MNEKKINQPNNQTNCLTKSQAEPAKLHPMQENQEIHGFMK